MPSEAWLVRTVRVAIFFVLLVRHPTAQGGVPLPCCLQAGFMPLDLVGQDGAAVFRCYPFQDGLIDHVSSFHSYPTIHQVRSSL